MSATTAELVDARAIADQFGVTVATVRRWATTRDCPAQRDAASRWLFDAAKVKAWYQDWKRIGPTRLLEISYRGDWARVARQGWANCVCRYCKLLPQEPLPTPAQNRLGEPYHRARINRSGYVVLICGWCGARLRRLATSDVPESAQLPRVA